jgi:hypothetical protein
VAEWKKHLALYLTLEPTSIHQLAEKFSGKKKSEEKA